MSGLFDERPKPKPGECCPTCERIVPYDHGLRASKRRPKTSKDAAKVANVSADSRKCIVLRILAERGPYGATDDEIDAITNWKHQCTTPVMNALRHERRIGWVLDKTGSGWLVKRVRDTRKGHAAMVNVLSIHGPHGFHDDRQTAMRFKGKDENGDVEWRFSEDMKDPPKKKRKKNRDDKEPPETKDSE